jgi:hypothetical protein
MPDDINNTDMTIGEKISSAFGWVESAASVGLAIRILAGLCALLYVLDIIVHRHTYAPGEGLIGFYCFVGFFAFTAIVLGAKKLRTWILRPEDYYAPNAVDSEDYPESQLELLQDSSIQVSTEQEHQR